LSLLEKIELLKKSGKRYNIESVNHLMNIINKNNIVDTTYNPLYNPISAFTDIIEHLDKTNSDIISEPLRRLLNSVIAQYKPNVMHDNTTPELDDLTNYF
jgi:3-methyladenine DNA glycosylase AlkD